MSDSDHTEILSEFRAVTNVAEDRAKFYLESANWNLQVRNIHAHIVCMYMNCQKMQVSAQYCS